MIIPWLNVVHKYCSALYIEGFVSFPNVGCLGRGFGIELLSSSSRLNVKTNFYLVWSIFGAGTRWKMKGINGGVLADERK